MREIHCGSAIILRYDSITKQNIRDPEGRSLYLEEGYTVVKIVRVYYDNSYSATETEYFIFDRDKKLVFNDVIANTYITG